ncbi:MAG: Mth938-like domain-containing protein [Steroidobacteraceae bacterium]
MKLTQETERGVNLVRGYGAGEVRIQNQVLSRPLLVSAQTLIADWPAQDVLSLTPEQLESIWALLPQVVLLGTGAQQVFPPAEIRRAFTSRGIALEPMDLGAACRTYNVLVQEDRSVVAALFP